MHAHVDYKTWAVSTTTYSRDRTAFRGCGEGQRGTFFNVRIGSDFVRPFPGKFEAPQRPVFAALERWTPVALEILESMPCMILIVG
jgi:hypothetical protein